MLVSQLTINNVCNHIREVYENLSSDDIVLIEAETVTAIQFCMSYTNLTQEQLDNYPDITIAILSLIADMWDNREYTINAKNLNPVVATILSLHCYNLVPTPEDETVPTPIPAVLPPNFGGIS